MSHSTIAGPIRRCEYWIGHAKSVTYIAVNSHHLIHYYSLFRNFSILFWIIVFNVCNIPLEIMSMRRVSVVRGSERKTE